MEKRDIIIFGTGGVGSWLAEWLVRANMTTPFIKMLILVDPDTVEEKNLQRQNFKRQDVGTHKSEALKNRLREIGFNAVYVVEKITTKDQLAKYNKEALAVITTDNQASKNLIAQYFAQFIIGNCDHDFSEIKMRLDNSDKNTWQLENGYTSLQDIQSNIRTAQLILTTVIQGIHINRFATKVQTERMVTEKSLTNQEE